MAGLTAAQMPHDILEIVEMVAEFLGLGTDDLFVADHTHEELSEGAYSIAYEGAYEWPFRFTNAVFEHDVTVPDGWHLEAGTGWYLACYPDDDEPIVIPAL